MIYEVTTTTLGPLHLDQPSKSKPITPYGIVSRTSPGRPAPPDRTPITPNRQPRFPPPPGVRGHLPVTTRKAGQRRQRAHLPPAADAMRGVRWGRPPRDQPHRKRFATARAIANARLTLFRPAPCVSYEVHGQQGRLSGRRGLRRVGLTAPAIRAEGPVSGRYYGAIPQRGFRGSRGSSPGRQR